MSLPCRRPHIPMRVFFPQGSWTAAHKLCAQCPPEAKSKCLSAAMKAEEGQDSARFGMFGGLSPEERARLAAGLGAR